MATKYRRFRSRTGNVFETLPLHGPPRCGREGWVLAQRWLVLLDGERHTAKERWRARVEVPGYRGNQFVSRPVAS